MTKLMEEDGQISQPLLRNTRCGVNSWLDGPNAKFPITYRSWNIFCLRIRFVQPFQKL